MSADDLLSAYDYELPRELIATEPLPQRDAARLMVLSRCEGTIAHRRFLDLPDLLNAGDLLVVNQTKVIPAKLRGVRQRTGGRWEGLFLEALAEGDWRLLGQTRGTLQPGEIIELQPMHPDRGATERFLLRLREKEPDGVWRATPLEPADPLETLDRLGTVPLPPYMGQTTARPEDWDRYQTTFAAAPGAVAAPTAGLHFTPGVFARCAARGIAVARVTLHVGIGTFRPIAAETLSDHQMHAERCLLPPETVAAIAETRARGGRVVAVGTTSVRTLEGAAAAAGGPLQPFSGTTSLFIRPPYRFRVVDALVTNFHLPRSSLLVLISALAGRQTVLRAYAAAIAERYRFYSYGDAMLIL